MDRTETTKWDRFKEKSNERHVSEDHQFWNTVYYVTKYVFAGLLHLTVLSSAVVVKGVLLILAWNINTPHPNSSGSTIKTLGGHLNYTRNEIIIAVKDGYTVTSIYYIWSLFLLIVTPQVFTTFYYLMRLIFRGVTAIHLAPFLVAFVASTLHSVGQSILVFSLLPALDPFTGLLYCTTVTFIPAVMQTVFSAMAIYHNTVKKTSRTELSYFILNMLGLIFVLPGIAMWASYIQESSGSTGGHVALFLICPVLVSCEWLENFLPDKEVTEHVDKQVVEHVEEQTQLKQVNGTVNSPPKTADCENKTSPLFEVKSDLTSEKYGIYCIINIWKVLLTFGMVLIIFGTSCEQGSACISVLFGINKTASASVKSDIFGTTWLYQSEACNKATPFLIAVVGIVSGVIGHRLCIAAVKVVAQVACFYLPLVLVTPATFAVGTIIVSQLQPENWCTFPFPWWTGDLHVDKWWYVLVAGVCGYVALIFSTTYMWTNRTKRMEDRIFFKPLYCGAFFEQSLLLNRLKKYKNSAASTGTQNDVNGDNDDGGIMPNHEVPLLYLCATMWHETETEMTQILTSLFRMDIDQCVRSLLNVGQGDFYEFEAHIFFDDAFKSGSNEAGEYVEMFVSAVEKTAKSFYPSKFPLKAPKMIATPYGGRIVYTLPGDNKLIVHLKDKSKIRNKKRWSQVMYMYYFLGHNLANMESATTRQERKAENTFILALDGDVDFRPQAVKLLLDRMKRNPLVGAACGRIHPIGDGPMVWYQKFEYAVSHWLIKSTEHVTGCVLCSPGCFSLFRGSALMECNVMKRYTIMPSEARHHIQYDQGEDRWLCTLLLKQGKKIDYCAASDAYTFAPEGFKEFFKQRRRWTPSTMANVMEILTDWKEVTGNNANMSLLYIILQSFWFISSLLTPGVLFLMIVGATNLAYPSISLTVTLIVNLIPIVLFVLICFFAKEDHQLNFAAVLSIAYSLVMMIVMVGLIRQSVEQGLCSITTIFLLFVAGVFVIAGFSHPKELSCLLHGPLFFVAIPSMSMLLIFYSIINLNNVSWGTREAAKPIEPGKEGASTEKSSIQRVLDNLRVTCSCCQTRVRPKHEKENAKKLDQLFAEIQDMKAAMKTDHKEKKRKKPRHSADSRDITQDDILMNTEEHQSESADTHEAEPTSKLRFDENSTQLEAEETRFWHWLIDTYLYPLNVPKAGNEESIQKSTASLKEELTQLRNNASLAFLLINALFVTIIFFLQLANEDTGEAISVIIQCPGNKPVHIEPISMAFTVVFGLLLAIQFICMLFHRWKTFLQINSITTFKREINVEQLLMDAIEDTIEQRKDEDMKRDGFPNPPVKKQQSFKQWLGERLLDMSRQVEMEVKRRTYPQEPTRGIDRFRGLVRTVSNLEKSLRFMSAAQVNQFNQSLLRASFTKELPRIREETENGAVAKETRRVIVKPAQNDVEQGSSKEQTNGTNQQYTLPNQTTADVEVHNSTKITDKVPDTADDAEEQTPRKPKQFLGDLTAVQHSEPEYKRAGDDELDAILRETDDVDAKPSPRKMDKRRRKRRSRQDQLDSAVEDTSSNEKDAEDDSIAVVTEVDERTETVKK